MSPDITSEGLPTARSSAERSRGHGPKRVSRGSTPRPSSPSSDAVQRRRVSPHLNLPAFPPPPPPHPLPFGSREPELALTSRCVGGRRRLTDAAGGSGKGRTRRCQLGLKRAGRCGGVGGVGGLCRREGSAERGALTWHGSRFLLHNATPRGLRWGEWGVGGWGSPPPGRFTSLTVPPACCLLDTDPTQGTPTERRRSPPQAPRCAKKNGHF